MALQKAYTNKFGDVRANGYHKILGMNLETEQEIIMGTIFGYPTKAIRDESIVSREVQASFTIKEDRYKILMEQIMTLIYNEVATQEAWVDSIPVLE